MLDRLLSLTLFLPWTVLGVALDRLPDIETLIPDHIRAAYGLDGIEDVVA